MTSESFFQQSPASDHRYSNLRDKSHLAEARGVVEQLWQEYRPLADRHFLSDAMSHFLQRFWEMYLGVTLKRKGFTLQKYGQEGPEFYFLQGGTRVWIEAVAPEAGTGRDAVPLPPHGVIVLE